MKQSVRLVGTVVAAAILTSGCAKIDDARTQTEPAATTPNSPLADYPPLTPDDYWTQTDCTDRQGIYPAASGKLRNFTHHSVGFEVWVKFTAPSGGVAIANAFTDRVEPRGSGSWKAFTARTLQISSCEVVCVGELIPIKRAPRMNCQEWADLYEKQ